MSVRSRATAAMVLTTAALAGTAFLPTAANAATPAAAKPALSTSVSRPAGALLPGGRAESVVFSVTNNTAKPQKFEAGAGALPQGALDLAGGQLALQATPLGRTPATSADFQDQQPGYMGELYPRGTAVGSYFTIPAHASFSWRLSLAATKAWPANDNGFTLDTFAVQPNSFAPSESRSFFKVGKATTGGPIVERLSGGTVVAPGRPAYETLTVTNRTGAALATAWDDLAYINVPATAKGLAGALATDVWVGSAAKGHWQPVQDSNLLNAPRGLANNATASFRLRVRLVNYATNTASFTAGFYVLNLAGNATWATADHQNLTVHRKA